MSVQSSVIPDESRQYQKKKSWLVWVVFALILIAVPINFITSSINPMQKQLDLCNLNSDLRQVPGNDLPPLTMEEFNRCLDSGGAASTYFFLTSLMILFNFTALEGLFELKRRAAIAYAAGLAYVTLISLIIAHQFPLAFLSLNTPIVLLLFWLWRRHELT